MERILENISDDLEFLNNVASFGNIMKAEFLEEISKLNCKQQQLLKDTINYGGWGDTSMTFIDKE